MGQLSVPSSEKIMVAGVNPRTLPHEKEWSVLSGDITQTEVNSYPTL